MNSVGIFVPTDDMSDKEIEYSKIFFEQSKNPAYTPREKVQHYKKILESSDPLGEGLTHSIFRAEINARARSRTARGLKNPYVKSYLSNDRLPNLIDRLSHDLALLREVALKLWKKFTTRPACSMTQRASSTHHRLASNRSERASSYRSPSISTPRSSNASAIRCRRNERHEADRKMQLELLEAMSETFGPLGRRRSRLPPPRLSRVWPKPAAGLRRLGHGPLQFYAKTVRQHADRAAGKTSRIQPAISDQAVHSRSKPTWRHRPGRARATQDWARLRVCRGIRVARKRVLRLMRENNLL